MAVLGTIVQTFMLSVFNTGHHDPLRGGIARQLIGDHHTRCDALLLEQLAEHAFGGFGIAPALHQNVEHDPVLVHGAPEPMLPAADADHNLV